MIARTARGEMENVGIDSLFLLVAFSVLSTVIALIAVTAGIGGGVLFTPIMLAFTPIDSLIVRGTGLIVAMFSGLVSSGPFMKSGLGNLKLSMYCNVGYGIGAYTGAQGAVVASERLAEAGDGLLRIGLGVIVFVLSIYYLRGGAKTEWPEVKEVDRFTAWLRLTQPYYESSTKQIADYRVTRAGLGIVAMVGVGLVSGFFGLGAGWAIVPTMNAIMGVPLKVAAACSGIIVGMGDSMSVWPYILAGAIIPLFAALWLAGQVLGGIVGAKMLIRVKAGSIRLLLIGVLLFSGLGLVVRGLIGLGYVPQLPDSVYVAALLIIAAGVALAISGRYPFQGARR